MIASVAMMLDYTFNLPQASQMIYDAINEVLELGYRTLDISSQNTTLVTTKVMCDLILEKCADKSDTIIEMVRMSYEG